MLNIIICVSIYLLGTVFTTIICYYSGVEKGDALGIASFWVISLPILLIFKTLAFPLYIYDLLEKKIQKTKEVLSDDGRTDNPNES